MEMETEMEKIERIKITPEMVNWEYKNNHSQCIHTGRSVHRKKNLSLYLTSLHKNRIFPLSCLPVSLTSRSLVLLFLFQCQFPLSFSKMPFRSHSHVPIDDLCLYVWENFASSSWHRYENEKKGKRKKSFFSLVFLSFLKSWKNKQGAVKKNLNHEFRVSANHFP